MALTKANAMAEVRRLINEPTENVFTDAQIGADDVVNTWLDRGARCVSALTLCEPATDNIDPVASTVHYTFTAAKEFIKIQSVVLTDTSGVNEEGLQHMDIRWLGHVTSATIGKPKFWYRHGTTLLIYPAPDATYGGSSAIRRQYG